MLFLSLPSEITQSVFEDFFRYPNGTLSQEQARAIAQTSVICSSWRDDLILHEEREKAKSQFEKQQNFRREIKVWSSLPKDMTRFLYSQWPSFHKLPILVLIDELLSPESCIENVMQLIDSKNRIGVALKCRNEGLSKTVTLINDFAKIILKDQADQFIRHLETNFIHYKGLLFDADEELDESCEYAFSMTATRVQSYTEDESHFRLFFECCQMSHSHRTNYFSTYDIFSSND